MKKSWLPAFILLISSLTVFGGKVDVNKEEPVAALGTGDHESDDKVISKRQLDFNGGGGDKSCFSYRNNGNSKEFFFV